MSVDRRMFLGGVVASRLAGTGAAQPEPMNAPPARELSIGVQPGVPNIIRARLVIISGSGPGSGLFVYSGPPAFGNLIYSDASAAGFDIKGNAVLAGATSYRTTGSPLIAVNTNAAAGPGISFFTAASEAGPWTALTQFVSDVNGNLTFGLSPSSTISATFNQKIIGLESAAISGTVLPGLLVSWGTSAPASPPTQLVANAAADRVLGIQVSGDAANFRLRADSNGRFDWGPGNAATDTTLLRSGVGQLSSGGQLVLGTTAAPTTAAALEVQSLAALKEQAAPGTPAAGFGFLYANSTDKFLHYKDETGQDGTIPATQGDLTGITVTAAAATRITRNWNIPANNPAVAGLYRLKAWGNGTEGSTAQNLTWSVFFNSAAIQSVTAAALTASGAFRWWVELILMINTIGAGGTCNVNLTGNWATTASPTVENSFTAGSAAVNGTAINTTVLNTLALAVAWASTTGVPTISELASTFERIGP